MNRTRWLLALMAAAALLPGRLDAAPSYRDATPNTSAIATDPSDSLFVLAGQLYAQRRFREAIPLFLHVVELDPRHGNAYALLGGSYLQLGDYAEAILAFERALQLDEGIKLAYIGLVAANYLTARIEAAQIWLVRLIPILNGEERDRYFATLSSQFPELSIPGS